jgi:hypothetical protein
MHELEPDLLHMKSAAPIHNANPEHATCCSIINECRVLGLRCALALCVYRAGLGASLFPFSADPSTAHPLLFLKNALAVVSEGRGQSQRSAALHCPPFL